MYSFLHVISRDSCNCSSTELLDLLNGCALKDPRDETKVH
jgi:hypothetical protein